MCIRDSHKALLSVGGATILGRIMDNLEYVGIRRVTVVTGFRSQDVEDFLRSGYPDVDLRLVHNSAFRETNNIVSVSYTHLLRTAKISTPPGRRTCLQVAVAECDRTTTRATRRRNFGRGPPPQGHVGKNHLS